MTEADRGAPLLEMMCQQVTTLTQAIQKLQDGYIHLEDQLQHLPVAPALMDSSSSSTNTSSASLSQESANLTPTVMMPSPEPRVPTPERFFGDRKKFRAFKNACLLYLALQPRNFSSEFVKVGFIISLLCEEPQAWAHNLLEQKSPALNSMDTFFEAMTLLYDDPQRMASAESALVALRQGERPVEDYTAEFRRWSTDTSWNEAALRFQYRQGLSETLKDELARVAVPDTLDKLIHLAILLDRRLRERRSECVQTFQPTKRPPRSPPAVEPTPACSAGPKRGPKQVGLVRSPLTFDERQRRRRAYLCLYCGGAGHFLRSCPIRPSKAYPPSSTYLQVSVSSHSYLALPISLQVAGREVQLPAIIDSGACSCFMDLSLANKLGVPLYEKKQRLEVLLADGSLPSSGLVSHETIPIFTTIDTGHQEFIRFDILCSPMFPIILGIP